MMFAFLYIEVTLKNIFACRLFRDTILELSTNDDETELKTYSEGIVFAAHPISITVSDVMVVERSSKFITEEGNLDSSHRWNS